MANITIRNIPESVFNKLKIFSEIEKRSLNNELLVALERGVRELEQRISRSAHEVSRETQLSVWGEIGGKWRDQKSKESQIKEIYEDRTLGRDVSL